MSALHGSPPSKIEVERAQAEFELRALSVEPIQALACQKMLQACFEPELLQKNYFELFCNLVSSNIEPGVIYCEPKIWPGPLSSSPGSLHLYTRWNYCQAYPITLQLLFLHSISDLYSEKKLQQLKKLTSPDLLKRSLLNVLLKKKLGEIFEIYLEGIIGDSLT